MKPGVIIAIIIVIVLCCLGLLAFIFRKRIFKNKFGKTTGGGNFDGSDVFEFIDYVEDGDFDKAVEMLIKYGNYNPEELVKLIKSATYDKFEKIVYMLRTVAKNDPEKIGQFLGRVVNDDPEKVGELLQIICDDDSDQIRSFIQQLTNDNGQICPDKIGIFLRSVTNNNPTNVRTLLQTICDDRLDEIDQIGQIGQFINQLIFNVGVEVTMPNNQFHAIGQILYYIGNETPENVGKMIRTIGNDKIDDIITFLQNLAFLNKSNICEFISTILINASTPNAIKIEDFNTRNIIKTENLLNLIKSIVNSDSLQAKQLITGINKLNKGGNKDIYTCFNKNNININALKQFIH